MVSFMRVSNAEMESAPVFALSIHLRVEVGVIEDDRVCARQTAKGEARESNSQSQRTPGTDPEHDVDALYPDTPGARRRDETEHALVGVEALGDVLPVLDLRRAVEAEVEVAVQVQERLEDVEDARHLREDQHAVAARAPLAQQPREHLQLPAVVLQQRRVRERDLQLHARPVQWRVECGVGVECWRIVLFQVRQCEDGQIARDGEGRRERESVNEGGHFGRPSGICLDHALCLLGGSEVFRCSWTGLKGQKRAVEPSSQD